jgi:hypothetical protein
MRAPLAILVGALAACGGDVVDVPDLGDYDSWESIELRGPAPGHGDQLRVVYVNDEALTFDLNRWAEGATIVKEVYDGDTATPDALVDIVIMRRCNDPDDIDPYDDGGCEETGFDWAYSGWLFTVAEEPGGEEVHESYCWGYCHQAAPYEGAFLDYTQLAP